MRENIAQFEVAQLANLCCEDAEEAKALIPRYISQIQKKCKE